MEIRLTANAGVLIKIDGLSILLDGVCETTENYLGTPDDIRGELETNFPDAVGITHRHSDHYDDRYATIYKNTTLRPILGSECSRFEVGKVKFSAVSTRHLGKSNEEHYSFIIEGSRRIFFMGDASPSELKKLLEFGVPDIIIVPFAYLNTDAALKMTKTANAKDIILVHMPDRNRDPYQIWEAVETTIKYEKILYFTKIGDTITLQ
ncbi:MAG: MBL fold metallo-hydrolase [Clostridia bacterium]|nr:MBL fold metallo-hydrolase [Clostridia bacterium]